MPAISQSESIDVRAPADVGFGVVEGDIVTAEEGPDRMTGRRPLDEGRPRPGFRWQQTVVHNRKLCHSFWTVSEAIPGRALEQELRHHCADTGRTIEGRERWEFAGGTNQNGTTTVTLRTWRIATWAEKLFGSPLKSAARIGIRQRLAYVQFEAERRAAEPVSNLTD